MPPVRRRPKWTQSRNKFLPSQQLDAAEVDSFLQYLFSSVAARPRSLNLRECAEVSRYLRWLSTVGVPAKIRDAGPAARRAYFSSPQGQLDNLGRANLDRIAQIIWGEAWLYASFEPADKDKAIQFLNLHAKTYLDNPYFESAMALAEGFEIPPDAPWLFDPPGLISGSMSMQGRSGTADDVSDRIYSAHHALGRAGIRKRSRLIAAALKAAGVEYSKRGGSPSREWSWDIVRERIKKHERRESDSLKKIGLSDETVEELLALRRALRVDHWIHSYKASPRTSPQQTIPNPTWTLETPGPATRL